MVFEFESSAHPAKLVRKIERQFINDLTWRLGRLVSHRQDRQGGITRFYVTSMDGERAEIAKFGHMSGGDLELKDIPESLVHDGFEQEKSAWIDWLSMQPQ